MAPSFREHVSSLWEYKFKNVATRVPRRKPGGVLAQDDGSCRRGKRRCEGKVKLRKRKRGVKKVPGKSDDPGKSRYIAVLSLVALTLIIWSFRLWSGYPQPLVVEGHKGKAAAPTSLGWTHSRSRRINFIRSVVESIV